LENYSEEHVLSNNTFYFPQHVRTIRKLITVKSSSKIAIRCYIFTVLTPEEILTSDAVAVTWGYRVLGSAGWLMSLVVCFSILGSMNGSYLSSGHFPYVAARNGHLPQVNQTNKLTTTFSGAGTFFEQRGQKLQNKSFVWPPNCQASASTRTVQ